MSESEVKSPLRLKERLETLCRDMVEKGILYSEATENFERCFIMEVLKRNKGNLIRSAATLGIHRNTLSKRVNHRKIPKR
ncbi:MAG TPA: helix-turn-helix domain-containing protein [Acidobacteriota bacterium]|nr:helix-turn-helix domain-containing protein [Acidobacteriota bacterium]